jgi:phosphoserine phosphatase
MTYVDNVTDPASRDYIHPQDRIATFDFDGTIYCEKPIYANFAVSIAHYRQEAKQDTTLRSLQPYKAALENDYDYMNHHLIEFLTLDYKGKPQEDYIESVQAFIDTTIQAELNIPYRNLFYIPMVELIEFLIQKEFLVFISSGSMTGFLRGACRDILPLEPHNIIGSRVDLEYGMIDSEVVFIRQEEIVHNNDAKGKAEGIYNHIGKPPVIAAGNSMGDIEMLRYTDSSKYPSLVLVINHDDAQEEYEYIYQDLLELCRKNNWLIISMNKDFKNIFIK